MTYTLTSGDHATILGVGPEAFESYAETPLELWERLRTGRPDRFASAKAISRACEVGLLEMLVGGPGARGDQSHATDSRMVRPGARATFPPTCLPAPPSQVQPITVVKVALWETGDAWAVTGMPRWVFASIQAQMMRAGAQGCRYGVLLSGGAWRSGTMAADPETWRDLMAAADAFREALDKGVPPSPQGPACLAVVKRLFPEDDGTKIALPADAKRLWDRVKALRKISRDTDADRKKIEARLRQWLGSAVVGKIPGGRSLGLRTVRAPGGAVGRRLCELH